MYASPEPRPTDPAGLEQTADVKQTTGAEQPGNVDNPSGVEERAGEEGPRQYFDDQPRAAARPRRVEVSLGEGSAPIVLTTDRGVFSYGRLDAGTRLLLDTAPPLARGDRRVLDLGCGWGPIACVAALRAPHAAVTAVDVNARALRLTARNASSVGAPNVTVAHPDGVNPELRFHRILSNPPIRIGKPALRKLLGRWLDRLEPGGRAHLVVHRNLGSDSLALWLGGRGHRVTRLVSRAGYRVLEVSPSGQRHDRLDGSGSRAPA